MKPSNRSNSATQWTGRWIAYLVFCALSSTWLSAADTSTNEQFTAAEPGEYANSLTLGVGHFFVDGDTAAFQRRWQRPGDETFGGVEELHYEQMVGERGLFTLDGRGLFNYRDYSAQMGLSDPQIGYVRGGYEQFRTFYDGSGGYSPLLNASNAWVSLYNEELFVDRGRAWIEAGLTLPDWPVFSVQYSYNFRDGMKDSTHWGDTTVAPGQTRSIVPAFLGLDERRHNVQADMEHTIENTTFGLGVRYSQDDLDNTRNITRGYASSAVRGVVHTDDTETESINSHGFVQTRFNPEVMLTVGGSYTHLDADISGSRVYVYPPTTLPQNRDEGFTDLGGGSQIDQYVANVNLMLTPWKDVTIVPSARVEHQDQSGVALFEETNVSGGNPTVEEVENLRMRDFTDVTGALSIRYTGITNWALYCRAELLVGQGHLDEHQTVVDSEVVPSTTNLFDRITDSDRFIQKYVIGANWYPCSKANAALQYYYRDVDNDYDQIVDPTPSTGGNRYPAFIDSHQFQTHDVNARLTLRPAANLTLVSRYDFRVTQYEMQGAGLPSGESAESTAHIFSQSVSWIPIARLYLQGSISYALQDTESPAADLTGAAAGLVQDAENDYWNASVSAGLALTPRSDLELQYLFFQADNYDPSNAAVGLPYGASARQHAVTATLVNRLRKNIIWKLQYGYFTGDDDTSGRNNDFDAHLVYSSWQFLF